MSIKAPVFRVSNHHIESCGTPPSVDGDAPNRYHSYFENEHGEQAVFTYDHDAKEGYLIMGDAGWENRYIVEDGFAPGLILGSSEQSWLIACWAAATWQNVGEVYQKFQTRAAERAKEISSELRREQRRKKKS
jgi:hypothetical protein